MKFSYTYLHQEYIEKKRSIVEIAKEHGVNVNTVARALKKVYIPIRTRSQAQKLAVKAGKTKSPWKGKTVPDEVKEKIRQTLKNNERQQKVLGESKPDSSSIQRGTGESQESDRNHDEFSTV